MNSIFKYLLRALLIITGLWLFLEIGVRIYWVGFQQRLREAPAGPTGGGFASGEDRLIIRTVWQGRPQKHQDFFVLGAQDS